jgi:hypothetical protein
LPFTPYSKKYACIKISTKYKDSLSRVQGSSNGASLAFEDESIRSFGERVGVFSAQFEVFVRRIAGQRLNGRFLDSVDSFLAQLHYTISFEFHAQSVEQTVVIRHKSDGSAIGNPSV